LPGLLAQPAARIAPPTRAQKNRLVALPKKFMLSR
jgi:hypothetical protein